MTDETAGAEMVMLVEAMVRALVDAPEDACVLARCEGDCVVMNVIVGPDDVGKVIGKQGRTARAMRVIVQSLATRTKVRYELNIYGDGRREERTRA